MENSIDTIKLLILVGPVLISIASAWFTVKFLTKSNQEKIQENKESIEKIEGQLFKIWDKVDAGHSKHSLLNQKVVQIDALLDPNSIAEYQRDSTKLRSTVDFTVDRVTRLEKILDGFNQKLHSNFVDNVIDKRVD
jgi:hypothetical protein